MSKPRLDAYDAYSRMLHFALARLKLHDPDYAECLHFISRQMEMVGVEVSVARIKKVLGSHRPGRVP